MKKHSAGTGFLPSSLLFETMTEPSFLSDVDMMQTFKTREKGFWHQSSGSGGSGELADDETENLEELAANRSFDLRAAIKNVERVSRAHFYLEDYLDNFLL